MQIKRQNYNKDDEQHALLQIIDISSDIMYDLSKGEKRLLSLINATVSHEMRNPTNSIRCQNMLQQQLNEEAEQLLRDDRVPPRQLRRRLIRIIRKHKKSIGIQLSSEKLLTFLVNDLLDFAQVRSNKFRQIISIFNLNTAIREVVDILKFKAQTNNIRLIQDDLVFSKSTTSSTSVFNIQSEICSDMQRIQQVILNLLSNAVKFTKSGGSVTISSKVVFVVDDLMNHDVTQFRDVVDKHEGRAMLEVSVRDTGVGIRE